MTETMLQSLRLLPNTLVQWWRGSAQMDLSSPAGRLAVWTDFLLSDHGILRTVWPNFDTVAPGVYRANQPSPARLADWQRRLGVNTVLNLRGANPASNYLLEEEACARLGIALVSHPLPARFPAERDSLLALIALFRSLPRPFVMHCKSGADRSSLAAALYLVAIENRTVAEARRMLSLRYVHIKQTATGVIDHFFDTYEARVARGPIPIERWIAEEYDPEALRQSWIARGGKVPS